VTLLLLALATCSLAVPDLVIKNSCSFGLWAEGHGQNNNLIPGETNQIKFMAPNGGTANYTIPASGLSSTRFWAKYGCDGKGANCLTGDQVPNKNLYPGGCPSNGCTPPLDSLFEASWGCKGSGCPSGTQVTWFDTSQVDGFTLPYRVTILGNNQCDCTGSGCTTLKYVDATHLAIGSCPSGEDMSYFGKFNQYNHEDLRLIKGGQVIACMSPCKKFALPTIQGGLGQGEGSMPAVYYCCPTPSSSNCQPANGCTTPAVCRAGPVGSTKYVTAVHDETSGVYAYSYDDRVGLHTCPSSGVQYVMEYCPPGSPAYPVPSSTSSSSSSSTSSSSSSSSGGNCSPGLTFCPGDSQCYNPSSYVCSGTPPYLCPTSAPHFCYGGCASNPC